MLNYQRVKLESIDSSQDAPRPDPAEVRAPLRTMRWFIVIPLSIFLCITQALITLTAEHVADNIPTSTMITVIGFGFLILLIVLINPLIRLVAGGLIRPFGRVELMSIMVALMVTAGVSTFGLADQLVPLIVAPWNPQWNTPQAGWDQSLLPHMQQQLYITDPDAIRTFYEGLGTEPPEDAPWSQRWAFYKDVFAKIPWGTWIKPLSIWAIFIAACYLMFYSLTHLVLDYWSKREKLIFPLAQLPESLLPESDQSKRWLPPIFTSPGFWAGAALSMIVLSYNAAIEADKWIPSDLGKLNLGMGAGFLENSYLAGFTGGGDQALQFLIIFTGIGIAFLLPLEISFSIWFYFILGRMILFIAVRMGYGVNYDDFKDNYLWEQNIVSAQGAGGLLLFSAIGLYRCLKEFVILALKTPSSARRRLAIAMPVVGLAISMAVMWLWLAWNAKWGLGGCMVAAMLTGFLVLITLGFMRIVAEGGIYWFQSHASFFHLFKMLGLGNVISPVLVGALMPIYTVLFMDIKTFLAPNLINAAKMREDVGGSRVVYHVNVLISLVISVVISVGYSIFLGYARGAQRMHNWFYSVGPKLAMDESARATSMVPQFQPMLFVWFCIGVLWVALSMYLRRFLFWFPHPVGYIMLVNGLGSQLWFSFFLGWVFKRLVVKYGGKTTYDKAKNVFIGLIIGELIAIFAYGMVSLWPNGITIKNITLNRYGP